MATDPDGPLTLAGRALAADPAGPDQVAVLGWEQAEALGDRLQGLAAQQACVDAEFCALVDRFDAGEGASYYVGIRSTAHFLGWACAMSAGVAREHVRVARALRAMPKVASLFAEGRLSYSKVRELTRVVGQVDEDRLCALALEMTASQVARTVSAFGAAAGSRVQGLVERRLSSVPTGGGMVRFTVVMTAEEAALVNAAVEAACRAADTCPPMDTAGRHDQPALPSSAPPRLDRPASGDPSDLPSDGADGQARLDVETDARPDSRPDAHPDSDGTDGAHPDDGSSQRRPPSRRADRVQALVDVAASYLEGIQVEPADDHTLVLVHVDARLLCVPPAPDQPTGGGASSADAEPMRSAARATSPITDETVADDRPRQPVGVAEPHGEVTPADQDVPAGTPDPSMSVLVHSPGALSADEGRFGDRPPSDHRIGGAPTTDDTSSANPTVHGPTSDTLTVGAPVGDDPRDHAGGADAVSADPDAAGPVDVPAGTSWLPGVCMVEGHGSLEPATVQRLLCTANVQGVLTARDGDVLALGRTRRLATRAQRRALRVRDHHRCQFPGCDRTTHLDAHHIVAWSHGGPTDLDNLLLLCRRHHTLVHEGPLTIREARDGRPSRWEFRDSAGGRITADAYRGYEDIESLTRLLADRARAEAAKDPTRLFPLYGGAGFILSRCVDELFTAAIRDTHPAAA